MLFSEIPYERPDMDSVLGRLDELTKGLKAAADYPAAKSLFVSAEDLKKEFLSARSLAEIRLSINTADPFYEEEMSFLDSAMPAFSGRLQEWDLALAESSFRESFIHEFGNTAFLNMDLRRRCFCPEISEDLTEERNLVRRYRKLMASAQIPYEGKDRSLSEMEPFKSNEDAVRRLAAWQAEGRWFREHQEELDDIFAQLVRIRDRMGHLLGYGDYIPLGYDRMERNCWGEKDVSAFREAVAEILVPSLTDIFRQLSRVRGIPWPMSFADSDLPLPGGAPVPSGNADEIIMNAQRFYDSLGTETGDYFRFMREHELMDLLPKKGKAPGGFCTGIYTYNAPFIFANFNGSQSDVQVLTHEAGHAFAAYLNMERLPLESIVPGMDGCEVHSLAMELFSTDYAELFFGKDADKYRSSLLMKALSFIPYGCLVDHFQHSVYRFPDMNPEERCEEWKRLLSIYMPWIRTDGGIPFYDSGRGWQRQQHIYTSPFYYIDYSLASAVALELWDLMQTDREAALGRYMAFAKQGGSRTVTEMLARAEIGSPFDKDGLRTVFGSAVNKLKELL